MDSSTETYKRLISADEFENFYKRIENRGDDFPSINEWDDMTERMMNNTMYCLEIARSLKLAKDKLSNAIFIRDTTKAYEKNINEKMNSYKQKLIRDGLDIETSEWLFTAYLGLDAEWTLDDLPFQHRAHKFFGDSSWRSVRIYLCEFNKELFDSYESYGDAMISYANTKKEHNKKTKQYQKALKEYPPHPSFYRY